MDDVIAQDEIYQLMRDICERQSGTRNDSPEMLQLRKEAVDHIRRNHLR